jgi:predicted nucleic acid-binding protein
VWSLALRRDVPTRTPEVDILAEQLESGGALFTTGLVLQELLQGFSGPKARKAIIQRFTALPFLVPDRGDHVKAADLRNRCRRNGLQIGTIDALLAQLCIRHKLIMLTTDGDFRRVAKHSPLRVWSQ